MDTKQGVVFVVGMAAIAAFAMPQVHAQQGLSNKILTLSDAEQVAFANSYLDLGMPVSDGNDLSYLLRNRSSLILPIIERKIEQVLRSPNPQECFSTKNVDTRRFVGLAAVSLAAAGDEQALREISKLLKLDEKRFDGLVDATLSGLISGNPFVLAYKGTDMGDPALDKRIASWVDLMLAKRLPDHQNSLERRWAEVMVDRYKGVPIQSEWLRDPIVSRMNPVIVESLRKEMFRLLQISWDRHPRRLLAMSDSQQIALVKSQLDQGIADLRQFEMREVDRRDFFAALARAHSSLVLPIIEAKIEEVLKSRNPIECFTNKSIDPQTFLSLATVSIAQAADQEALKAAGRLQKLNKRFGGMVELTLINASIHGNPFPVAYRGLELGDSDVDNKIMAWVEERLAQPTLNIPKDWKHQWAQAMSERYGGIPPPTQWSGDPIVSRLKPGISQSLHNEVVRFATEASENRLRK